MNNVTCDQCGKHHSRNPSNVQVIYEQGDGTVRSENFCDEACFAKSREADGMVLVPKDLVIDLAFPMHYLTPGEDQPKVLCQEEDHEALARFLRESGAVEGAS